MRPAQASARGALRSVLLLFADDGLACRHTGVLDCSVSCFWLLSPALFILPSFLAMPSCFVAHVRSCVNRFLGREGSIRLSLADDGAKKGDAELPFVISGEQATKAGYTCASSPLSEGASEEVTVDPVPRPLRLAQTGAQLLLECILCASRLICCSDYQ